MSSVQAHSQYNVQPLPARQGFSASFVVILISLLFVAIFGGALVGGITTGGNPSDAFFFTIIGASSFAIAVAAFASIRYYITSKKDEEARLRAQGHLPMKESERLDIQGTFTRSEDEEEEHNKRLHQNKRRHSQAPNQRPPRPEQPQQQQRPAPVQQEAPVVPPPRFPVRTPVESRIQEIDAPHTFPGDVSAMSPSSYDLESYGQTTEFTRSEYQGNGYRLNIKPQPRAREQQQQQYARREFDFASVATSARNDGRISTIREDPPEDMNVVKAGNYGNGNISTRVNLNRDPSAARVTPDGQFKEEESDVGLNTPAASNYDVRDDINSVAPDHTSAVYQQTSMSAPPPPPKTASEAGSTVSSMFLKPFAGMFGKKNKNASSEAGYSEASSFVKGSATGKKSTIKVQTVSSASDVGSSAHEGRPPMPGRKTGDDKRQTIGGDRYAPSTPGNNSTYSIPPPRRIPNTPESEAPSGFQSMAEDSYYSNGVASSTFDPVAHERAMKRIKNNMAPLGATLNDMPVYYEEDESAVESAAPSEVSPGYDVFAPPGPIGIVVDTTEKGCIVHSLKKTSPMQGLINPGDLIVALDDFDVRKMDAASLTKLMAKKSQQKERKFTLIPSQD